MSVVTSSLSIDQQKKLLSVLSHVRLHLLYKASVHGFTAAAFHNRCDKQGPTVIVAYNAAGFVFGAYTSKDYTQSGESVRDEEAFLYSICAREDKPLRVAGISGQSAFTDGATGPNYGALVFLHEDKPEIQSNPGTSFTFQAAAMHGEDLALTEFEVFRVEGVFYPHTFRQSLKYIIGVDCSKLILNVRIIYKPSCYNLFIFHMQAWEMFWPNPGGMYSGLLSK